MYSVIKIKVNEVILWNFLNKLNMICQNVMNKKDWSFDCKMYFEMIYGNLICILKYVK